MNPKVSPILKEVVDESKPDGEDLKEIERNLKEFLPKLKAEIKKLRVDAEVFVGGSYARNTMMKSKEYDVDIFLRFKKGSENISDLTEKLLKSFKKIRVHGSRDYFKIKINEKIIFEVVPVIKVKNPKEAENITDLSYFHVNYVKMKLKSQKIINEILIAKAFCHASGVYGAESYIHGFSGYSIELLIQYYGSFLRFLKETTKKSGKIVIDIEKDYKNKQQVLMDLNSAKLNSPIVLVDPTYKQRNALAALSKETFDRFVRKAKEFLRNPSKKFFERKELDIDSIRENAKGGFVEIEVKTSKQEGDIAGSKLLKFYNYLSDEISRLFDIKDKGFVYNDSKTAKYFFIAKNKGEMVFNGPSMEDSENVKRFKQRHKNTFVKGGNIYAREKNYLSLKEFLNKWRKDNQKRISEMSTGIVKVS